MTRHVAFLRAINVGGRFVRMPALVAAFEDIGMQQVSTFIASGNVVFRSPGAATGPLTRRIETRLHETLGFEVTTFLRTDAEVKALAADDVPMPGAPLAQALNVIFLADALTRTQHAIVQALSTDVDSFAVRGREVFWLCRRRQSESKFSNAVFERRLGVRSTLRTFSTVQRLAATLD